METRDIRLVGTFTLRSPLSHIGETIGTTAYLVTEPVLQPDGSVEEIACYSGNAWRGHLRDLAAVYLLERLGGPTISLDAFHLLFSGGRIGGEQGVNLERARAYRQQIPLLALWGGGVGNQILPGKLRVANCYPVCREAPPSLLPEPHPFRERVSYRQLTIEKSFSRKDDAKDDRYARWISAPAPALTQGELLPAEPAPKPAKDVPADQMRMTVELLIAGTVLETAIDVLDCTEVELGCLVSALHEFARSPHIGGQASKGHGLVDLTYDLIDLDTGERSAFLAVTAGAPALAPPAERAKAAYDAFLLEQYTAMVEANAPQIRAMLGAG